MIDPLQEMEGFITFLEKTGNIHLPLSNEKYVNILEEKFNILKSPHYEQAEIAEHFLLV